MVYSGLLLLVEGADDARLVKGVALPCLAPRFDHIEVQEWTKRKDNKISALIRSYRRMGFRIILIGDRDNDPCPVRKQRDLLRRFDSLRPGEVVVCEPEVEAWYLAGAPDDIRRSFDGRWQYSVDGMTKEEFERCMPGEYRSRISLMTEIVKDYSVSGARIRSDSFDYFVDKSCE